MGDPYAVSITTFPVALGGPRHPSHAERLRDNILIQVRCDQVLIRFYVARVWARTHRWHAF